MKLARKLTLALVLAIVLVLFGNAFVRVQSTLTLFDGQIAHDHRVFGKALADLVAGVAGSEGVPRAQALVRRAESMAYDSGEEATTIRWVSEGGAFDRPQLLRQPFELLARDGGTWIEHDESGVDRLHTYLPVRAGVGTTAIEIIETLGARRDFLRSSFLTTAITTLVIAAVCGMLAAAIGLSLVGRPVARLVAHARRIGEGDFSARLDLRQRDELGMLATEMNAMASALDRANARIVSETDQRIRALEQLRQADRLLTVGRLASGIAHELGTPLNVIEGRALQIAMKETSPEQTVAYAELIVESTERMTNIIRQLLDFGRRREPERAPQDVRGVVRQTLRLVSSLARRMRVDLSFEEPPVRLEAPIDASQIQQVLTNVIVNALHASSEGSEVRVALGMAVDPKPPAGVARTARRYMTIAVVDRGLGIPPENQRAIFEPFFTTKDVGEGTGLGLSVSWGIAREHDGWIGVESEVGRGSTFTIYLPVD